MKGKKVKVLYEDDKSTTAEASQKVRQLIDRDKVVAILGEVASSRSLAGGLIANTSHIPMITPSSTAVEVTQGREWVFRTCFTDDQQGQVAARFVKNELKKNKVGVFYAAQDTYSSGLAKSFRDRPTEFPVYAHGFDRSYLDSLGPLQQPRRAEEQPDNVAPMPQRRGLV